MNSYNSCCKFNYLIIYAIVYCEQGFFFYNLKLIKLPNY